MSEVIHSFGPGGLAKKNNSPKRSLKTDRVALKKSATPADKKSSKPTTGKEQSQAYTL